MNDFESEFYELVQASDKEAEELQAYMESENLHFRELLIAAHEHRLPAPAILQAAVINMSQDDDSELLMMNCIYELRDRSQLASSDEELQSIDHDFAILGGMYRLFSARCFVIYSSPNDESAVEAQHKAFSSVLGNENVTGDEKRSFVRLANAYLDGYVEPLLALDNDSELSDAYLASMGKLAEVSAAQFDDSENSEKFKAVWKEARTIWERLLGQHDEISRFTMGAMIRAYDLHRWNAKGQPADFTFGSKAMYEALNCATPEEMVLLSNLDSVTVQTVIDNLVARLAEIGYEQS